MPDDVFSDAGGAAMAAPSILTYLGLVGPFACGLAAMAVSRELTWLAVGLLPAVAVGLRGRCLLYRRAERGDRPGQGLGLGGQCRLDRPQDRVAVLLGQGRQR